MFEFDVIIVGAGATGLIAARELTKTGKKVLILEAHNRLGGRVYSFKPNNFSIEIETGAEFVHGDAPATKKLLEEFNISVQPDEGKTYRIKNGSLNHDKEFIKDFPVLLKKVNSLKKDMTFSEFINEYLAEEKYLELRKSVISFIEGYDAADINEISTFSLREEWNNESASNSFHIKGGYGKLFKILSDEIINQSCKIKLSSIVKEIKWKKGSAELITSSGESFFANKVLITVPLSILISEPSSKAHINFSPELSNKTAAFNYLGFESAIKIFFEFKKDFWENEILKIVPQLSFIFSDSPFTAWWTQLPDKTPLLTGWLSGPNINKMEKKEDNFILEKSVESLSYIFDMDKKNLKENLTAQFIINWENDPFSLGGYAYAKPGADDAIKEITDPAENTLFFAGEAFYKSDSMGTVEAAFQNGLLAAEKILIAS